MAASGSLNILYLVHDLHDAAVHKRVVMLRDGGATVTVAGFRRDPAPVTHIAGSTAINLGQTYNGRFIQRITSVIKEVILLNKRKGLFTGYDVIIARNLEMLAIAVRANSLIPKRAQLVYECLDIHRLMLNEGFAGKMLRDLEGWLCQKAQSLITSSPAFIDDYFNRMSKVRLPIVLVENKVYHPAANPPPPALRKAGPPWRIGWFGAIRCRKSLQLLCDLVRDRNGEVEVVIRGRPAFDQFEDFHKTIADTPGMRFYGPYKNPDDLESIYGDVHFTWAIDMFEEGLNSSWLLPNRLYEGGRYYSVPIAQENVETGRFLQRLGIGITFPLLHYIELADFFRELTAEKYQAMQQQSLNIPESTWSYTTTDCKTLVDSLRPVH